MSTDSTLIIWNAEEKKNTRSVFKSNTFPQKLVPLARKRGGYRLQVVSCVAIHLHRSMMSSTWWHRQCNDATYQATRNSAVQKHYTSIQPAIQLVNLSSNKNWPSRNQIKQYVCFKLGQWDDRCYSVLAPEPVQSETSSRSIIKSEVCSVWALRLIAISFSLADSQTGAEWIVC